MDYFSSDGTFWLPGRSDQAIPGTLTFDADGNTLHLQGCLHESDPDVGVTKHTLEELRPVVHGRLHDGEASTLLDASFVGPAAMLRPEEIWRVDFVLTGGHVAEDLFDQAQFDFDALMPWTQPSGIVTENDDYDTVQASLAPVTIMDVVIDGGPEVRLLACVDGSWSDSRVHFDQHCLFEKTGASRNIRDVLNDSVRSLQDLLIVCLGRPVLLTSLSVRRPGAGPENSRLAVFFRAVQPQQKTPPTQGEIDGYDAPTLVTRSTLKIPIEDLISTWYSASDRLRGAVTLFCGPFYASFIYSEHRYASTFQAAEALARKLLATREKSRTEHRERVRVVTEVLQKAQICDDIVRWATGVLEGRNDKPLPALIDELTRSTGDIGKLILQADPNFPQVATNARVGVSHGGAKGADAMHRYWLGEALGWIVRVRLLVEAGEPLEDLASHTVQKPWFRRVITELSGVRAADSASQRHED